MEVSSINSSAQIMAEFYAQQESADDTLEQSIAQQQDAVNAQAPQTTIQPSN